MPAPNTGVVQRPGMGSMQPTRNPPAGSVQPTTPPAAPPPTVQTADTSKVPGKVFVVVCCICFSDEGLSMVTLCHSHLSFSCFGYICQGTKSLL